MNAITINNVSFKYAKTPVINNLTTNFAYGKFTIILGQNGSGKSTLIKLIAGLLPYYSGDIFIENNNLKNLSLTRRSKIIGYLGQKHKSVFPFTVNEVVVTGRAEQGKFLPTRNDYKIVDETLNKLGIYHLKERIYTELSGGEQQLVMIARVIAKEPKILLLDEPTTHLDFCNQTKFLTMLKTLKSFNITVISVLHDPNLAFIYGDDFVFIKNGTVIKPEKNIEPWNEAFLQSVYNNHLKTLPYNNKALIVPVF